MADIEWFCGDCGQSLTIGREYAGMQVECPKCKNAVVVPGRLSPAGRKQSSGSVRRPLSGLRAAAGIALLLLGFALATGMPHLFKEQYPRASRRGLIIAGLALAAISVAWGQTYSGYGPREVPFYYYLVTGIIPGICIIAGWTLFEDARRVTESDERRRR